MLPAQLISPAKRLALGKVHLQLIRNWNENPLGLTERPTLHQHPPAIHA